MYIQTWHNSPGNEFITPSSYFPLDFHNTKCFGFKIPIPKLPWILRGPTPPNKSKQGPGSHPRTEPRSARAGYSRGLGARAGPRSLEQVEFLTCPSPGSGLAHSSGLRLTRADWVVAWARPLQISLLFLHVFDSLLHPFRSITFLTQCWTSFLLKHIIHQHITATISKNHFNAQNQDLHNRIWAV